MSFNELLPTVEALSRNDRLRLLQYLVAGIAREEGVVPLEPDATYPVWIPYDATEAAATLLKALYDEQNA